MPLGLQSPPPAGRPPSRRRPTSICSGRRLAGGEHAAGSRGRRACTAWPTAEPGLRSAYAKTSTAAETAPVPAAALRDRARAFDQALRRDLPGDRERQHRADQVRAAALVLLRRVVRVERALLVGADRLVLDAVVGGEVAVAKGRQRRDHAKQRDHRLAGCVRRPPPSSAARQRRASPLAAAVATAAAITRRSSNGSRAERTRERAIGTTAIASASRSGPRRPRNLAQPALARRSASARRRPRSSRPAPARRPPRRVGRGSAGRCAAPSRRGEAAWLGGSLRARPPLLAHPRHLARDVLRRTARRTRRRDALIRSSAEWTSGEASNRVMSRCGREAVDGRLGAERLPPPVAVGEARHHDRHHAGAGVVRRDPSRDRGRQRGVGRRGVAGDVLDELERRRRRAAPRRRPPAARARRPRPARAAPGSRRGSRRRRGSRCPSPSRTPSSAPRVMPSIGSARYAARSGARSRTSPRAAASSSGPGAVSSRSSTPARKAMPGLGAARAAAARAASPSSGASFSSALSPSDGTEPCPALPWVRRRKRQTPFSPTQSV